MECQIEGINQENNIIFNIKYNNRKNSKSSVEGETILESKNFKNIKKYSTNSLILSLTNFK